jgi:hypothetical protein
MSPFRVTSPLTGAYLTSILILSSNRSCTSQAGFQVICRRHQSVFLWRASCPATHRSQPSAVNLIPSYIHPMHVFKKCTCYDHFNIIFQTTAMSRVPLGFVAFKRRLPLGNCVYQSRSSEADSRPSFKGNRDSLTYS